MRDRLSCTSCLLPPFPPPTLAPHFQRPPCPLPTVARALRAALPPQCHTGSPERCVITAVTAPVPESRVREERAAVPNDDLDDGVMVAEYANDNPPISSHLNFWAHIFTLNRGYDSKYATDDLRKCSTPRWPTSITHQTSTLHDAASNSGGREAGAGTWAM
ncbi:hypothetical protein BJ912DRAFT_1044882 [Pholiota molesta]|nr:hypothetical protein BJ912DRAFT_1044882 [Pholiota molesta]